MDRATFEATHDLERRPRQVAPINVECLSPDEIDACVEHPAVHAEVKRCAQLVQAAYSERLAGNVDKAMRIEAKMQRVYETLPVALRW